MQKKLKELTIEEIKEVSGGFWNVVAAIAAVVIAGCASNPKKPHHDDMNPQDHIPRP